MIQLASGQTLSAKAGTNNVINCSIFGDLITTTDDFTPHQALIPSSVGTLYTSTGGQSNISSMTMVNTSGSDVTGVQFYIIGTNTTTNPITNAFTIPASAWATYAEGKVTIYNVDGLPLSVVSLSTATPQPLGVANAGTASLASRSDHVHAMPRLDQVSIPTADVSLNSRKITDLADGVSSNDAVTKNQLDNAVLGLEQKASCDLATIAALPANTYNNGSSGVGATLTGVSFGALVVDGTTVTVGMRILVKNEVATARNGIYRVTTVGAVATLYVLTRATDFDGSGDTIDTGDTTYVTGGSTLSGTTWTVNSAPVATVGTDTITFTQTAGPGALVGGTGIVITGNTIDAQVDGATIEIVADTIRQKDGGTTNAKLANMGVATVKGSVAGGVPADLTPAQVTTNFVVPDGSTLEISSNQVRQKDAGTTNNKLANMAQSTVKGRAAGAGTGTPVDLSTTQVTALINPATASLTGAMTTAQFSFLAAYNGSGIIFVTSNNYSNLAVDGATDDLAALNALYSGAPDGSTLVWPGQNKTMVLSGAAVVPAGKHFIHVGGGSGNKTNVLQTSLTADHFTNSDWYSTWTGFNFTTNNTSATGVQALTSGTVLNVNTITTALVPASGSINIGSAIGWQVLTYSARTATTITLSSNGTGNSIAGIPIVFKTAGAAINAGNLVGIDCIGNTFSYCYNGYICAGSTSNQSRITGNGFLNTINFDVWIDGANWNGIIDSNTMDCTTNSRSVSHCEITQCGSVTGQGNQFIRGQFNMRLGSTTAAYPAGVFGVYFANCFFDNAGTDAIRIQGISAVQRVKITSSWLSSASANGLNFASTASTLPTDIELIGCNIYSNTTAGIAGAGVQDYKVIGGQVAGNGTGFLITAATGNVYSVTANGVRIGPTGGIGANTTGINVATGTYAQVKFDNCDTTGNTTALTLGTVTVATWSRYAFTNNPGINPHNAVVGPPAATPVLATTYTNVYGFRVLLAVKHGATANTSVTIDGIANTMGFVAAQVVTYQLEPGMTWAVAGGTAPTVWVWNGV